jgi:hypothetical protein
MLVLVAFQSEANVFHLVTEIMGLNPTSDSVDNDWAGTVPLKKCYCAHLQLLIGYILGSVLCIP